MLLNKPIVFLSHSSRDKAVLGKLKNLLDLKTSGTVEFFLSSDGESIPFGRNWVARVSEALNQAKLMFIFLSPNSIGSGWIFFEAGHAYSKDTRVVPVCLKGVDLAKVPPPLSLLQGFNVHSCEHLNNLLKIMNDAFKTRFSSSFTEEDYLSIFDQEGIEQLDKFDDLVEEISFHFQREEDDEYSTQLLEACAKLGVAAARISIKNSYFDKVIGLPGAAYHYQGKNHFGGVDKLKIVPSFLTETLRVVDVWLEDTQQSRKYYGEIVFCKDVDCVQGEHKIAAKLKGLKIEIGADGNYDFEALSFQPYGKSKSKNYKETKVEPAHICFEYEGPLRELPVMKLVDRLFQSGTFFSGTSELE